MRPQNLCWTTVRQEYKALLEQKPTLLQQEPFKCLKGFRPRLDNLKLLLNFIVQGAMQDDCKQLDGYPLVRLHSPTLKSCIHDYQKYVTYLQMMGVIYVTAGYQSGKYSKGYTFREAYRTTFVPDLITDRKVLQRLQTLQRLQNREAEEVYPHLCRWFEGGLEINCRNATEHLNHLLEGRLQHCSTSAQAQSLKIGYAGQHLLIAQIAGNYPRLYVDGAGNRFYSPLTNLKKDLRHFVTFRGQSLACVDVSCCQPFLIARLLEPSFYTTSSQTSSATNDRIHLDDLPLHVQERVVPLIPAILQRLGGISSCNKPEGIDNEYSTKSFPLFQWLSNSTPPNTPPICAGFSDAVDLSSVGQEVAQFRQQVSSGQFYEHYQSIIETLGVQCPADRDSLKESVYSAIYSKNDGNSEAVEQKRRVFKAAFPAIFELMSLLKSNGHATLSVLLQSIEAQIVLNRIGGRISRERPDQPLFSIHDSLCVPVGHEAYLQRVMVEELERAVGLKPSVKVEVWGGGVP